MKKFKTIFLSFAVSAALASNTFGAALTLTYDGSVHKYTGNILKLKVNGAAVTTDIPPVIIENRSMVPARAVFEKLGASVKWNEAKKEVTVSLKNTEIVLGVNNKNAFVNKKNVKMDVPAKIINNRTMIPVRFVSEQLGAKVGWYPEDGLVTISDKDYQSAPASLNKIECAKKGDVDQVTLYVDNYKDSNVFKLIEEKSKDLPYRIVVDLANTNMLLKQKPDITGSQIKAIRYSQDDKNKTRVVLDLTANSKYKVQEMDNKLVLSVSRPGLSDRGGDVRETVAPKGSETTKPTLKPTETPKPTMVPSPTATPTAGTIPNPNGFDVSCSKTDGRDEVSITTADYKGYKVIRYTNPDKIVIDIPNARTQADMRTIDVNSSLIRSIRYSMLNENTARVVLDVIGQPLYRTDERDGKLVIVVEAPTYSNIEYYNNGDRVGLILPGVKLTESDAGLKQLYTGSYDETGKSYTIMFPSSQGNIGTGTLQINDTVLDKVEMYSDPDTGMCSITITARDRYIYNAVSRSGTGNTVITMLKPAMEGETLVVIDPGHGGSEPGAQSFGISEKDFNLDISKRLNALLKANGIRTYIIREDDSYVGLFERTSIANNLNATLFLSIHNNANDRASSGTETLYYPGRSNSSGFTSKRFAQIIQSNLISDLGMKDRGIVERPGLAVLRTSAMPGALAEIAFMDNKSDFAKLQSEDFRQRAAQSLCNSIIQSLGEVN